LYDFNGDGKLSSWYEKCMPKIKEIKPYIEASLGALKKTNGVKSIYVWGSYAKNINKSNYRVKDIDVLARTIFHSGDLISINKEITESICSDKYLESQGFDPLTVKFSENFLKLKKYNIDCWVVSSDRKLLHWGPILINKKENEEVKKMAERHAENFVGIEKKKLNKTNDCVRKNWYNNYCSYIDKYFEEMPTGWYKTEEIKIKELMKNSIRI
jgi:predicted nucleotidyltransferase